ncbi:MAG: TlpA disulfide reductase family protein [Caldilineaceae bacterium]
MTDPITLADLPPGIGRGYPVVSFSGIDNDAAGLTQSDPAPNFHMVLPDGKYLTLADLRGRPVLINFWATWCGPCRLEMPEIVAEASRNEELVVLAVNVQEELTQLQPFTEDFQMIMPVIQDSKAELRQLYEVTGMPTSVFIDRDGNIAAIWRGILTGPALHDFLAAIQ